MKPFIQVGNHLINPDALQRVDMRGATIAFVLKNDPNSELQATLESPERAREVFEIIAACSSAINTGIPERQTMIW